MKTLIKLTTVLMVIFVFTVNAQKKDYSDEPGYIEFGEMGEFGSSDEMAAEVIIEAHLLKLVGKLAEKEDPGLAELIGGLKLIKVNVYDVNESNENDIGDKIASLNNKLSSDGWDRIVRFKDKGETANVYIRTTDNEDIVGLTVLTMNKNGEAAFVNIVGMINLETISKLSDKFDIPGLNRVHK